MTMTATPVEQMTEKELSDESVRLEAILRNGTATFQTVQRLRALRAMQKEIRQEKWNLGW